MIPRTKQENDYLPYAMLRHVLDTFVSSVTAQQMKLPYGFIKMWYVEANEKVNI